MYPQRLKPIYLLSRFNFSKLTSNLFCKGIDVAMKPWSHLADMLKDVFFVFKIGKFVVGGSSYFLTWVFSSLLGTLVLPYVLSLMRLIKYGYEYPGVSIIKKIGFLFLCPVLPIILLFGQGITQFQLENCQRKDAQKWMKAYGDIKQVSSKFIKTELGLETTIQITMSILLLLFSRSDTRTEQGLEGIFDSKEDILGVPAEAFIVLSLAWSIKSAWSSYVAGISWKKDYFSFKSQLFLGIYVVLSVSIKTVSLILFLLPTLGLANTLRHFQAELKPYKVIAEPHPNGQYDRLSMLPENFKAPNVEAQMFFADAPPIPWSVISRFDYSDPQNPMKPSLHLYTIFSTKVYLVLFWVIIMVQPIFVFLVKKFSNPGPFSRQDWLDKIIHSMENSMLPSPLEDFEELPGTVDEHVKRSKLLIKEIGWTILANFFQHLLLMSPLCILCK